MSFHSLEEDRFSAKPDAAVEKGYLRKKKYVVDDASYEENSGESGYFGRAGTIYSLYCIYGCDCEYISMYY